MAHSKNALIRQRVLDRCLRGPKHYTLKEMMDKCNDALEFAGFNTISSKNTILSDFSDIERDFPGAKPIFKVMEISLLFTTTATAIPSYIIMSYLGMIDTSWALIVPYVGSTMGLYLMKQHLSSTVPNALLEAARIDGASELRIFASIVMPLAKPAWLTMMMFAVQSMWTQQGASQIFSEAKKPLTYALNQIVTGGVARAGAGAAVQLILITPPILMFVLIQSQVLDTMASSGMKD